MSPTRPCLGPTPGVACPTRALTRTPRCPACTTTAQHAKDQRRPQRRTARETTRRRDTITAHVTLHGWRCPGSQWCGPAHPSVDLTADHIVDIPTAMAQGQTYEQAEAGPLTVLCRSANSARSANTRHTAAR
jgi:hypothetical protein